jgi:hypothetical protein
MIQIIEAQAKEQARVQKQMEEERKKQQAAGGSAAPAPMTAPSGNQ